MSYKFSNISRQRLDTCHPRLISVMEEVIKYIDFSVIEGFRGKEAQDAAYAKGNSKLRFPQSKHNKSPSMAVDIAPYPIDWSNKKEAHERFVYLAGYVMCVAEQMGIMLRWGGDWNMNDDMRDESFRDYPHFELVV